ncbi:hypothetical protein [Streptomyces chrestomyceticus]|nr:hypothetical protein [Streptomyces chrestomyceticus]
MTGEGRRLDGFRPSVGGGGLERERQREGSGDGEREDGAEAGA